MPKQKQYRDLYTEHCIRHPNDYVTYTTFRWRVRNRGEKLAIRLGRLESAPKTAEKIEKKKAVRKAAHLAQKKAWERRERLETIVEIAIGVVLFGLGLALGLTL